MSQGRLLYPALVAFSPLLAAGWQAVLTRRLGRLLVVPLALLAVATSAYYLPTDNNPEWDLDMASYGIVKVLPEGRAAANNTNLPWQPKAAFQVVADHYRAMGNL